LLIIQLRYSFIQAVFFCIYVNFVNHLQNQRTSKFTLASEIKSKLSSTLLVFSVISGHSAY
jgi:hypothetical protein